MKTQKVALIGALFAMGAVSGCGGRPSYWNDTISSTANSYGLNKGVAIVDDAAHRVVIVTATNGLQLEKQSLPIGHQVTTVTVSADGSRLFVLSAGDQPQRTSSDQGPRLTVISFSATGFQAQETQYSMSDPLTSLAIDPGGHWAIAYVGTTSNGAATSTFLENPNEIVLFDLTNQSSPGKGVPRTLRSFGGTPQQLIFTPELSLPWATNRHLLIVQSNIDVTLLDLDRAFQANPPSEITLPLTSDSTTQQVTPAGVAVNAHPANGAAPGSAAEARFALWASNSTDVYTVQLIAPSSMATPAGAPPPNDFAPTINLTDVGGIPSDVAYVEAGSTVGLQVAALVPAATSAVVFDPDIGITTSVALPAAYANLSLVTSEVASGSATSGTDVALLWNAGPNAASGVALWTLSQSVSQPYASIKVLGATQPINATFDIPNQMEALKVLQMSSGNGFYVLDLTTGTAAPLVTYSTPTISISPDGQSLWAFEQGGTSLAAIENFSTLDGIPLSTDLPIAAVYDIARSDGGRALVALHEQGAIGATVFDARSPSTASSLRVSALLLEGP